MKYRTQFLSLYRQLLRQCEQLPGNNMHKKLQHINTVKQRFRSERIAAAQRGQDNSNNDTIITSDGDHSNNTDAEDDARAAELMTRAQQHLSYLRMISPRNSTAMYHERNAQARHAALSGEEVSSFAGKRVFKVDPQTKRFVEVTHSEPDNTRISIGGHHSASGGELLDSQHPFFENMAYVGDPLPQDDDGWELTDGRIIIDESIRTR